jgi:serine protein kinase
MSNSTALGFLQSQGAKSQKTVEPMDLANYLDLCKEDKAAYASAAGRLLKAIGKPRIVDTSADPKLSRIFQNKQIAVYDAFKDFYGMEDVISSVVSFLQSADQGLEESKQILYLLGPVGSAKSSLAEKLKALMQKEPFFALAVEAQNDKGETVLEVSPVYDNPLGLFSPDDDADALEEGFGINKRYLKGFISPWAVEKLEQFGGDKSKFKVVQVYPSIMKQIAISKTEPGDENNQDITALVGKVNIRKLEDYDQDETGAYSYSGGLCRANRGLMEFVEMFKAPIKVLHPLLTATQEGNYNPSEAGLGSIPFDGVILAHSNESEWEKFRNNKDNEAFISRTCIVRVPYTLQVSNEMKIYNKLLRNSALADKPCAPQTVEMLAQWSVMTRLKDHADVKPYIKMRIYDGENLKDTVPNSKPLNELRDAAGLDEGFTGMDTRFAFKTLSKVFNFNTAQGGEIAANPIHLMYVLRERIDQEQLSPERTAKYLDLVTELEEKYYEYIKKEIQTSYLESYAQYGQNIFDSYITYADLWVQDQEFRNKDTGEVLDRKALDTELAKIERPAGISNPKDFRNEVVNFVWRSRANNEGKNPDWKSYEKLRLVIEKKMFTNTDELLPVIAYTAKGSKEEQQKHDDFVKRMGERGYTPAQTRMVTEYYTRRMKNG